MGLDVAPDQAGERGGRGLFARHPRGLETLFFTELWERFSYYGMRALLVLFMVAPAERGGLGLDTVTAASLYGSYTMAVYMLAIPGGFAADALIGPQRAVLSGGAIIALGHFTLAIPAEASFYAGLVLIAFGTGLFKPAISALVGSLYAEADSRRDAGFALFYMGINIGAFIAPLVTGFLAQSDTFKSILATYGFDPRLSWHWGFAAAGIGMSLALAVFARRRAHFQHAMPVLGFGDVGLGDMKLSGGRGLVLVAAGTLLLMGLMLLADRDGFGALRWLFLAGPVGVALLLARSGDAMLGRFAAIFVLFVAAMVFWALFEQAGVSIALFADELTRNELFGFSFPSAWFQSLNALFVILLTPVFAALWLGMGSAQPAAPLKFALGLFFLAASFAIMVPAAELTAGGRISPLWLVGLFFLQTVGELLLSPVGLSTMTKLAPRHLVGLALGIWFLAAAFGNKLAGIFAESFTGSDPAALASFFLALAGLAAATGTALVLLNPWVRRLMGGVT